jgi:DNA replication protein DnaC
LQLDAWFEKANARTHRTLRCRPVDRLGDAAARALPKLAEPARAQDWSYEQFADAPLETEHASREAHGGESRIRAARFPARRRWRSSTSTALAPSLLGAPDS